MAASSTVTKAFTGQSALNAAGQSDYAGASRIHTLVVVAGAGVSAGVVSLELSVDGVNWWTPASNTLTLSAPGVTAITVVDVVATQTRARISTGLTGGTCDAWIGSAT